MSTSKDPPQTTVPPISAETGDLPDASSKGVLAPKSPVPKLTMNKDPHDGQSLASPIAQAEITNITSATFTEVPNLVEIISKVLATTLHELKAVHTSPHVSVASTSSPVVSIPDPSCHVPPVSKVAVGPPSDPSLEASLNFTTRKEFHDAKLLSQVPSTVTSHVSTTNLKPSDPPDLSNPDTHSTTNHSHGDSVPSSTHSDHDMSDPLLAPKSVGTHYQGSGPLFLVLNLWLPSMWPNGHNKSKE